MLELKNIKKNYRIGENVQTVLKGVTIRFRKNEFASILGASGSGKTTLLNIIGGLDHYDAGELIIDGISTKNYQDYHWDNYRNHRIGFIFQSYNLISHQTILSNVELALTLSGISKKIRRKKAKEALIKVGLKDHLNKRPNQLSGGQMQRVAIARALVNNPEIILADEPTGALDSETSLQIMEILKEVAKEKLVIMVTHNPELAKIYSTRIIELKDGLVLKDSNPYNEEYKTEKRKTQQKKSMSFKTSLGLSFNNLLTKKGRTFLTAFAGSIGILGIALILALSSGVSNYVEEMERKSLADFPLVLEENSYDFTKLLEEGNEEKIICSNDKICSQDDITKTIDLFSNKIIKKNHLKEFKQALETNETLKKYISEIKMSYNLELQIYSKNNNQVHPNQFNAFELNVKNEKNTIETPVLFEELLEDERLLKSKYKLLTGTYPKKEDELVLIIGQDQIIPDSILYALDIKDRKNLSNDLEKIKQGEKISGESTHFSYEEIMNTTYKLILNTDYYQKENGRYKNYSEDKKYLEETIKKGLDLKIVGILQTKEDTTTKNVIGYTPFLTKYVLEKISKTELYQEQKNNREINVLTGEKFDGLTNTYEQNCQKLGIADLENPNKISLYPTNFESKEQILAFIEDYNKEKIKNNQKELVVSYTDVMNTVVSGITSIVNTISFILIGFVAISLMVSSIMIAIITYISVLERTKEIGILRAIGASKKDVIRVFKSETIIEGLLAGLLGISITLFVCLPLNAIIEALIGIDHIAQLPLIDASILMALSVLLTLIAGLIPSKIASKKDPVEALRSE